MGKSGRPSEKSKVIERVREYLEKLTENPGSETEITITSVCTELGIHRSVINRHGLNKEIRAAALRTEEAATPKQGKTRILEERIKELTAERDEWRKQAETAGVQIAYALYNASRYDVGDPNDLFKPPPGRG